MITVYRTWHIYSCNTCDHCGIEIWYWKKGRPEYKDTFNKLL